MALCRYVRTWILHISTVIDNDGNNNNNNNPGTTSLKIQPFLHYN